MKSEAFWGAPAKRSDDGALAAFQKISQA